MIETTTGWKLDTVPAESAHAIPEIQTLVRVDDAPESVSRAFETNFKGTHKNYIALMEQYEEGIENPIIASVSLVPMDAAADDSESDSEPIFEYRVLLRDSTATELFNTMEHCVTSSWWRKLFNLKPTRKSVLRAAVGNDMWNDADIAGLHWQRLPDTPDVRDMLRTYEQMVFDKHHHHSVGVLLQTAGQEEEEDMFSNEDATPEFDRFLAFLGETVDMVGWKEYAAGLNTEKGYTGKKSVFSDFKGHKTMCHVSTMLPYSRSDRQQIERKRFIGNDHVVVVFQDGPAGSCRFSTKTIRTNMTTAYVVISRVSEEEEEDPEYQMSIATQSYVAQSRPVLPETFTFRLSDAEAGDAVRTKLINLSNAVWNGGILAGKMQRMKSVNLARAWALLQ